MTAPLNHTQGDTTSCQAGGRLSRREVGLGATKAGGPRRIPLKREIHTLWKKIGEAIGNRPMDRREQPVKEREGL